MRALAQIGRGTFLVRTRAGRGRIVEVPTRDVFPEYRLASLARNFGWDEISDRRAARRARKLAEEAE